MVFRQATWDEPLLIELSSAGRRAYSLPAVDKKIQSEIVLMKNSIDEKMLRGIPPQLPELSEPAVVRHFVRLSQMNFGIDLGMYPLGSCTMKYNPKVSQRLAKDPRLAQVHPYQHEKTIQGILEILYELQEMLSEISGMDDFTLSPAAGAQGEYVGALIIRNYLKDRGLEEKDEMLVPDSAHGTNPASAAMAGFQVVKIPSSSEGIVTEDEVRKVASKKTAGMMLTVPNTLGLFEKEILNVTKVVHESGGLMYYDGANMNALLGRARPGDMGFDIVHINVHKTFATPHGGGGPGAGPVGVKSFIRGYLPIPIVSKNPEGNFILDSSLPKSIGRVKSFFGNIGVLLRAYCYILSLGSDGMKTVSEQAVLASNYLLSMLNEDAYERVFLKHGLRKHEFVVSASQVKKKTGITAGEIAKAILNSGMHSPTTYFPLIVTEALMVEPTETEPVENLESYAQVLNNIAKEAASQKETILESPTSTSIGKLDEYRASHPSTMVLNWNELHK